MTNRLHDRALRFECTGCGDCCRSRGRISYVYVTLGDRRRLARHLGVPTRAFTRVHCEKTDGRFHLRRPAHDCEFLEGARCTVYAARPGQCRTYPFWPENLREGAWTPALLRECEGAGRGRRYPRDEIRARIAEQRRLDAQG